MTYRLSESFSRTCGKTWKAGSHSPALAHPLKACMNVFPFAAFDTGRSFHSSLLRNNHRTTATNLRLSLAVSPRTRGPLAKNLLCDTIKKRLVRTAASASARHLTSLPAPELHATSSRHVFVLPLRFHAIIDPPQNGHRRKPQNQIARRAAGAISPRCR